MRCQPRNATASIAARRRSDVAREENNGHVKEEHGKQNLPEWGGFVLRFELSYTYAMHKSNNTIEVKQSLHGLGVFACKSFTEGERILTYGGELQRADSAESVDPLDHCLQIDRDLFLGPSGMEDDFLNHSCDPNSAVIVHGSTADLIALRDIAVGEEIVNDYSLTVDDDSWQMECSCGAKSCRGVIHGFKLLPLATRERYQQLGIVPKYNFSSPHST